jgi:Mg-chelatase subunit ChlI
VSEFASQARQMAQQLKSGDCQSLVDKLASQVHLLDVLFTRTIQLAVNQNTPERMLALMDMALKVQNNTRRTASTINDLTHPKVANNYIRTDTANVATNQQINYSEKNLENELNTGDIHEMDRRGSRKASRADQIVETLVEVDRSKD